MNIGNPESRRAALWIASPDVEQHDGEDRPQISTALRTKGRC